MKKNCLFTNTLMLALCGLAFTSTVQAQATRTWVSGLGDDANPCSRTAPCKTFAGAYSRTAAGGEIDALDPAGYGTLTISKSITVDGGGVLASVLSAGTNGFVINGGPNDVISLRNISIQGIGTGLNGIRFLSGKSLHIENVIIANVTTHGIDATLTAAADMTVLNTVIRDCGGTGINMTDSAAFLQATIVNVRTEKCASGISVGNDVRAAINNSVMSLNSVNGLTATGSNSEVNVDRCTIAFNNVGVQSGPSSTIVKLTGNSITTNATGVSTTSGTVFAFGNNVIFSNTLDGSTTPQPLR